MIDAAVAALRAGKPVVLPTDTVYGLCAEPLAAILWFLLARADEVIE